MENGLPGICGQLFLNQIVFETWGLSSAENYLNKGQFPKHLKLYYLVKMI